MNDQKSMKISIPLVLILVSLMVSFILVQIKVFNPMGASDERAELEVTTVPQWGMIEDIKAAKGMYLGLKSSINETGQAHFVDDTVRQRTLESFYSLRAYSGAPPRIPHPIVMSKTLTGDSCLGCHENGGYTPKFQAYAPIVPHPEKLNCRQCHNPGNENSLYRATAWTKNPGKRGRAHLPGSPLVIPHSLQMRENCLSCHSGPAAVVEIRTTHPERINCMQCHVEKLATKVWVR